MNSNQVMSVAQSLYQAGYITYMRTDSINLSTEALGAAKEVISKKYGKEYLPTSPRVYKSKIKNAQEAHEAIRPTGSTFVDPVKLKSSLSEAEYKLYDLIWKRTVASQMKSAKIEQTRLEISDNDYMFIANGKTIIFPGFLRAYVEGADDPGTDLDDMPDEVFRQLTDPDYEDYSGLRSRAKELTADRRKMYMNGRLGMVIDGTGHKYNKINEVNK